MMLTPAGAPVARPEVELAIVWSSARIGAPALTDAEPVEWNEGV